MASRALAPHFVTRYSAVYGASTPCSSLAARRARGRLLCYPLREGSQAGIGQRRALQALEHAVAKLTYWCVYAAILMPDHLHLIAAPRERNLPVGNLSAAIKRWMRQEMRANCRAGAPPAESWQWQPGSFDRLLRSDESAQSKWEYMRENPVRAGLVKDWSEWSYSIGFRPPSRL